MNKRGWLWIGGVLLALAAWMWLRGSGLPSTTLAGQSATEQRPNVVLFVIDTLRSDRLNSYGYTRHETSPHIDALAHEGVRFEQAYAAAPWTLPSMASVMLSRFACEHGALSTRTRMTGKVATLAERLHGLGYTTLGLYANTMIAPEFGFDRGFDRYQESAVNTDVQAAELLKDASAAPFFLYVHSIEPHNPERQAPDHTPGFRDVPRNLRDQLHQHYLAYRTATRVDFTANRRVGLTDTTAEQDRHMAFFSAHLDDWSELYDAAVRLADARLGTIVAYCKQRGVWDNTLVIFMADHGEEFLEHGGWTHGQAVYDEQLRVPLIIKLPGAAHRGEIVDTPVSLVDLLPTVFDWLGRRDLARDAAGASLLPLMGRYGRAAEAQNPRVVTIRHNVMNYYRPFKQQRGDLNVVVRDRDWKAIWNVEPDRVELYQLAEDPHETLDLADVRADLVERLRAVAAEFLCDCRPAEIADEQSRPAMPDAAMDKLRSLGYVD